MERKSHTAREILGSLIYEPELQYFVGRISLDAQLSENKENLLAKHLSALKTGDIGMNCQYDLSCLLERKNAPIEVDEQWDLE